MHKKNTISSCYHTDYFFPLQQKFSWKLSKISQPKSRKCVWVFDFDQSVEGLKIIPHSNECKNNRIKYHLELYWHIFFLKNNIVKVCCQKSQHQIATSIWINDFDQSVEGLKFIFIEMNRHAWNFRIQCHLDEIMTHFLPGKTKNCESSCQ